MMIIMMMMMMITLTAACSALFCEARYKHVIPFGCGAFFTKCKVTNDCVSAIVSDCGK